MILERTWRLPEGDLDESLRTFLSGLAAESEDTPHGLMAAAPLPLTGSSVELLAGSLGPAADRLVDDLLLSSTPAQAQRPRTQVLEEPVVKEPQEPKQGQPKRTKLHTGGSFAGYELLGLLGRGGMGSVLLARAPSGEQVALKVVRAGNKRRDARLAREGRIAASLDHPGIVKLLDQGQSGHLPFLVYELVPGAKTLDETWEGQHLVDRVVAIRDAARALGYAHARGVVHRDVKPENLLVDRDGRVRVTDFGLARADDLGLSRMTRSGTFLGTAAFAAPEQLQGQLTKVGPRADVWALGVVLYQALTGELPFWGDSFHDQVERVTRGRYTPASELEPSVTPALEAVIARALQPDLEQRYPDANAFAAALDEVFAGRGRLPLLWRLPLLRARYGARPFLAAAALTLTLTAGLLAWACAGRSPEARLCVQEPRGWTAAPILAGQVEAGGEVELRIDGDPVALAEDGSFRSELALRDGRRSVEVELRREGELLQRERCTLQVDRSAPALSLELAEDACFATPKLRLTGRLDDASPCELSLQGQALGSFVGGETFAAEVTLAAGLNELRLEAQDAAGNRGQLTRRVWL
ncbi:MAG TPA: hypothetical protein DEA08_27660, partial [Planctomycetes bacterium]|nr:hypothetical protein [Planctomycetota bacterium]